MRVISGLRKGHRLIAPKGMDVRPTEDKIKESLFNILGPIGPEARVLDLFAGSGSIGIEFLSRGAKIAYFVDVNPKSIIAIRENLMHTKLMDSAEILKSHALRALKTLKNKDLKFDYIYLDPPYDKIGLLMEVIERIAELKILAEDGLLIVEHDSRHLFEEEVFRFKKVDERKYKAKTISFLKWT